MQVSVQTGDLDGLLDALAGQQRILMERLLNDFAIAFVAEAKVAAPERNGRLRQSVHAVRMPDGFLIQATAPYALYVLTGVRPQYMRWLVGRTVAFTARDGTRVVRRVTRVGEWDGRRHWYHPGTPARDFFREAWESGAVRTAVEQLARVGIALDAAFLYEPGYRG